MPRVTTLLRKGYKAIHDFDLLKALQSEIRHEQSSNHFQDNQSGSLGDFVLDWDSPQSQDVVLRKKCESGEEVAVSALLGPETYEGQSSFPREALMKTTTLETFTYYTNLLQNWKYYRLNSEHLGNANEA
ncbi:hypothetical protein TEA_008514 [Camellia sinensis var. sinensis]|uniref:Uncharacterized protein n=1 Tax=Camellia sinensis var. sinensis TaxID=542762 RepID=A0A4S4ENH3_CAMSN|nr:hypothetical protein TEA_008514 [Camellia sinensis var. sinensis]